MLFSSKPCSLDLDEYCSDPRFVDGADRGCANTSHVFDLVLIKLQFSLTLRICLALQG